MKVITQRRDTYKFKIVAKKVAGIVLTGQEIKSLRNHQVSINEAYILPHQQELYLHNVYIGPYRYAVIASRSDKTSQKLLLKKTEITHLITQMKSKHYNMLPLQIFINDRGWAKVEIVLVQSLKKFQRKAEVKEKAIKKKLQRREYD